MRGNKQHADKCLEGIALRFAEDTDAQAILAADPSYTIHGALILAGSARRFDLNPEAQAILEAATHSATLSMAP